MSKRKRKRKGAKPVKWFEFPSQAYPLERRKIREKIEKERLFQLEYEKEFKNKRKKEAREKAKRLLYGRKPKIPKKRGLPSFLRGGKRIRFF